MRNRGGSVWKSKHNCLYFNTDPLAESNSGCPAEDAETVFNISEGEESGPVRW